jgi:deferrochelatase/peroxidase EfeB
MDTNDLLVNTNPIAIDPETGDPKDRRYVPLFRNLQGHILKDNGRDFAVLLFLRFNVGKNEKEKQDSVAKIKETIADLAWKVTSTSKQLKEGADYRDWRKDHPTGPYEKEQLFVNCLFSADGYRTLGFGENELPNDRKFREGLGSMFFERKDQHTVTLFVPLSREMEPKLSQLPPKLQLLILQLKEDPYNIETELRHHSPEKPTEKKEIKSPSQIKKRVRADSVDSAEHLIEKLEAAGKLVYDMDPDVWDDQYEGRIDAMILLALDDENLLKIGGDQKTWQDDWAKVKSKTDPLKQAAAIRLEFERLADVYPEKGITYYDSEKEPKFPMEHFGFLDGVSNPLFFQKDIEDALAYEGIKKFDKYNPWAPLQIALVKDPNDKDYGFGSYLAYLKLEQNVKAFLDKVEDFKSQLNPARKELAEAFVMGRFKDGTPALTDSREGAGIRNNFTYHASPWESDDVGGKCPLHAHIRKVNSRSNGWTTRIVRRGITYGSRKKLILDRTGRLVFDPEDKPTKDVGVLFMSFQSNIETQFERIARDYVMKDNPRIGTGFDCIIGRGPKDEQQLWPDRWGETPNKLYRFPDYNAALITMKGGKYFFAPSINFLKQINTFQTNNTTQFGSSAAFEEKKHTGKQKSTKSAVTQEKVARR